MAHTEQLQGNAGPDAMGAKLAYARALYVLPAITWRSLMPQKGWQQPRADQEELLLFPEPKTQAKKRPVYCFFESNNCLLNEIENV